MKDQFVTYDMAKRLKELGFNEPCMAIFDNPKNVVFEEQWVAATNKDTMFDTENPTAPLWQQAIDWLRIEHGLIINVIPINDWFGISSYGIGVKGKKLSNQFHEETFAVDPYDFDLKTYEQAREAAILKALTLIP